MRLKLKNILMILKKNGRLLKLNHFKIYDFIKFLIIILLTNLFFHFFIKSKPQTNLTSTFPKEWVEIQIEAELITPFEFGKNIIMMNQEKNVLVHGKMKSQNLDEGVQQFMIHEKDLLKITSKSNWKILPASKFINIRTPHKVNSYEIYY